MKVRLEQALHLGAAAMTLAAAFGLNPMVAALSLPSIRLGRQVVTRANLPHGFPQDPIDSTLGSHRRKAEGLALGCRP